MPYGVLCWESKLIQLEVYRQSLQLCRYWLTAVDSSPTSMLYILINYWDFFRKNSNKTLPSRIRSNLYNVSTSKKIWRARRWCICTSSNDHFKFLWAWDGQNAVFYCVIIMEWRQKCLRQPRSIAMESIKGRFWRTEVENVV